MHAELELIVQLIERMLVVHNGTEDGDKFRNALAFALSEEEVDHWSADPLYSVFDWRQEVASDSTRLGYWDWVKAQKENNNAIG